MLYTPNIADYAALRRSELARVLQSVLAKVLELDDVRYIFSSSGDQMIFMQEMLAHGLCPANDSPDLISFRELNTPWYYANPRTFMCHYHELSTELRQLFMSMDSVPEAGFEAVEDGSDASQ